MVLLAPKLSDSVLNNQLLKHFAKCQLDEQPSIRTNVNNCLGKIAQHLSPAVSIYNYTVLLNVSGFYLGFKIYVGYSR